MTPPDSPRTGPSSTDTAKLSVLWETLLLCALAKSLFEMTFCCKPCLLCKKEIKNK